MESEIITRTCEDTSGILPPCAPLAIAYVPPQQKHSQMYNQIDALANGTLFPSLNLPFHLKTSPSTLAEAAELEIQALSFVLDELGLYLDTHKDDREAFKLFRQYSKMEEEARLRYEAMYGPLSQKAAAKSEHFDWCGGPWPWEYHQKGGKR